VWDTRPVARLDDTALVYAICSFSMPQLKFSAGSATAYKDLHPLPFGDCVFAILFGACMCFFSTIFMCSRLRNVLKIANFVNN